MPIEQAIYGYRDGHRLLAASFDIPKTYELKLLSLTDPILDKASPIHLSGVALERHFFAISRTWPAPEEARPGAVWSHVLFLPPEMIESAYLPSTILSLLARPHGQPSSARLPTLAHVRLDEGEPPIPLPERRLRKVLAQLYGTEETVDVSGSLGEQWDYALWRIWAQLWPAMRWNFAFVVGSRQPSSMTRFDLQVDFRLRSTTDASATSDREESLWVQWLANDLRSGDKRLSRLLWRYGPSLPPVRRSVMELVTAVCAVEPRPATTESAYHALVVGLATLLQSRETTSVVRGFLGGDAIRDPDLVDLSDDRVLPVLLHSAPLVPVDDIDFIGRMARWWAQSPDKAFKTLEMAIRDSWPWAADFAHASARIAADPILTRLPSSSIGVATWSEAMPQLASRVELWTQFADRELEIAESVIDANETVVSREEVISAVVRSNADLAVHAFVASWGVDAIEAALRSAKNGSLSQGWLDEIRGHSSELAAAADRIAHKPVELGNLIGSGAINIETWARLLDPKEMSAMLARGDGCSDYSRRLRVTCGFLNALRHEDASTLPLLIDCFVPLHEELADRVYPEHLWWILERYLVRPKLLRDWDRCDRLRRTVALVFKERNGDAALLRRAAARIRNGSSLEHLAQT